MNKTRKILIIAGVVVFVLIGVLGLALKGGHGKAPTTTSKKTSTSNNNSAATTGDWHTVSDALGLVRATYLKATAYVSQNTTPDQGELDAVKPYMTNDLYVRMTQTLIANSAVGDQILCTTQGTNTGYDVQLNRIEGPSVLINVAENFNVPINVTYTVDLINLQITDISCPTS